MNIDTIIDAVRNEVTTEQEKVANAIPEATVKASDINSKLGSELLIASELLKTASNTVLNYSDIQTFLGNLK